MLPRCLERHPNADSLCSGYRQTERGRCARGKALKQKKNAAVAFKCVYLQPPASSNTNRFLSPTHVFNISAPSESHIRTRRVLIKEAGEAPGPFGADDHRLEGGSSSARPPPSPPPAATASRRHCKVKKCSTPLDTLYLIIPHFAGDRI